MKRICGNCLYWSPKHPCLRCEHNDSGRPLWKPRDMSCTVCSAPMDWMQHEFLRCPDCGSEFWPFANEPNMKTFIRQEFEKNLACARVKEVSNPMIHVKGNKSSGSKSKRAKPKNLMQKPSQKAIYDILSAQKPEKAPKRRKVEK